MILRAMVAGLTPKGPAKNSGILVGDVILEFDGKRIDQMRDLPRIVAETPVGNPCRSIFVERNGTVAVVQHHEVITKPVHFQKSGCHHDLHIGRNRRKVQVFGQDRFLLARAISDAQALSLHDRFFAMFSGVFHGSIV